MTSKLKIMLVITIVVAGYFGRIYWLEKNGYPQSRETAQQKQPVKIVLPGKVFESVHYKIHSTARPEQTVQVASAVESLYSAYSVFFKNEMPLHPDSAKPTLMLYRDRAEFAANNRSSSWAEAYYLPPVCYAYYSSGQANPYHWMIHEATHQLNRELSHFKIPKWVNEGLASYFGTSKIVDDQLQPGIVDKNTYPIWWLSSVDLSGDLRADIARGKIIPLRHIIAGKGGPDINQHVNLYYIEYWSFTHFLFHYENGKYAKNYRTLITEEGTLANFEKTIGPVEQIQSEWYGYLRQTIIELDANSEAQADSGVVVDI